MDQQNHKHSDATQQNAGQATEGAKSLHAETNMGKVGDHSANHAWSQMQSAGQAGGDRPTGAHSSDHGPNGAGGPIDFAAHGDIYGGHNGVAGGPHDANHHGMAGGSQGAGELGGTNEPRDAGHHGVSGGSHSGGELAGANPPTDAGRHGVTAGGPPSGSDQGGAGAPPPLGDRGGSGPPPPPPPGDRGGSGKPSDGGIDKAAGGGAPDWARPPQLDMPSAQDVASAPVEHLQAMAQENNNRLRDYVDARGENIPSVGLHGTTALSGKNLSTLHGGGEVWVAGPHPDRKEMGGSQYVGDLSASMNTSMGYSENRGAKGDNTPGPVLVYDASNQPKAWSTNQITKGGTAMDGLGPTDQAKFGQLDVGQAKLLGSVSREQMDGMKQQFTPLDHALQDKQRDILGAPGGPDASRVKDLQDRVAAVNQIRRAHEASAVLDVVANSRNEW